MSLPTAPPNSAERTRTRRVLVPARYAGDQRVGRRRQPLVARQCLGPPFADLAGLVFNPGTRHPHRLSSEGAGELSLPVPMAITLHRAVAPAVAKRCLSKELSADFMPRL